MSAARLARPLAALGVAAFAVNVLVALVVAPPAANFAAPITQRVFYFHVPAALAAYAAFTIAAAASALFLRGRAARWDRWAHAAAEVGAVLTTIALFTGIVWSRVEFFSAGNVGNEGFGFVLLSDPKFVTTAALWLVFLGYLALRRQASEGARARLAAVFAILGYLAVPMSYLSSRFSPHPDFLAPGESLDPRLGGLLAVCVACWLAMLAALLVNRVAIEEALADEEERAAALLAPAEVGA
jgi:heme exporter protein C